MRNLLKSEFYKLVHGKEFGICIVALLVFSLINVAFGGIDGGRNALTTESREIVGLIVCTMFAVTYVGKDFTSKTVYHALTSGNSRGQVFGSKYICYEIVCLVLLLLNALFMGGIYSAFYGWGQPFNNNELFFAFIYPVIGAIFDLCIMSVPFIICVLLRNNSLSLVLSFGFIGLLIALSQMAWDYFAQNIAYSQFGIVEILCIFLFLLVTSVLYFLSVSLFKKQDVQ